MYANLLGQKAVNHLTDEDMAQIIGVSRTAYGQKIRSGRFWPGECQALCNYFGKPFDFLFDTDWNSKRKPAVVTAGEKAANGERGK